MILEGPHIPTADRCPAKLDAYQCDRDEGHEGRHSHAYQETDHEGQLAVITW